MSSSAPPPKASAKESAAHDQSVELSHPPQGRQPWPSVGHTLTIAAVTTAVVAALSHWAPAEHANSLVGLVFLGVAWFTAARGDEHHLRAYGVSLGGLTEPLDLSLKRIVKDSTRALGWTLLAAVIFFPPFWFGFRWWRQTGAFEWVMPADATNLVLGQLLVVALPEEAFYRGFLQSALEGRWAHRRVSILGAQVGPGLVLSCLIFALGHLLTVQEPVRLAVFFPALVFGWLRVRSGGIGAAILFHALCNLLSHYLARGYGLIG